MTRFAPLVWWAARCGRRVRRGGARLLAAALVVAGAGCSQDENPLADYDGARALDLLRVTQSFTPEIQWVGGRVAAVGVNRGTRAALDSTLVWLRTAPGNAISSYATVGQETAAATIVGYGGTPQERLTDGETYTFWIAEASALDVGLDSLRIDTTAFADTTLTMQLLLRGQQGGSPALGVRFEIERDERLTGERFIVRWTPETVRFRHLALRPASTGSFADLVWYLFSPEGSPPQIAPPVTMGEAPPGVDQITPFAGFSPSVHTLWGATDDWNQTFGPTAPGYAFFRIFANNFPADGGGGN